jgi:glycosyltransferase involved in cell wall biosynthesis
MNKPPILSICMLVYNQPEDVQRLLGSISSQIDERVEIVIRDDSTNDDTKKIVHTFSQIPQLKYHKGSKQGIDKTILFLTKAATGRFIWWMGDDDISSDAIGRILDLIIKYPDLGFLWANYKIINTDTVAIDIPESRFFKDIDELLEKSGTALGFISSCIFNRLLALNSLEDAKRYIGTEFVNLFIVLHVITSSKKCYFLCEPIVLCYPASNEEIKKNKVKDNGLIENNAFNVFGVHFFEIVSYYSDHFRKKTIRNVIKKSFGQTWRGVLVGWAGGWDTPRGKRIKMIKVFYKYPEAWIAIILFSLPSILNKSMYGLYRYTKYKILSKK